MLGRDLCEIDKFWIEARKRSSIAIDEKVGHFRPHL